MSHPLENIRPATLAKSAAIGDESAAEFARLMRSKGWNVRPAPPSHDRLKHIDFYCQRDGKTIPVDVKGRKAHSDTHVLIEIRGIKGHAGSMFGDGFLAFHTGNEFLLVPRSALFAAMKKKLNFSVSFKGGGSTLPWPPSGPPTALLSAPKFTAALIANRKWLHLSVSKRFGRWRWNIEKKSCAALPSVVGYSYQPKGTPRCLSNTPPKGRFITVANRKTGFPLLSPSSIAAQALAGLIWA